MKLCGVEIPADIEIPELDAGSKAELDELHEYVIWRNKEIMRGMTEAAQNYAEPHAASQPVTISIETLRKLPLPARARVLYTLREQVTD